ncbi:GATA transcription factor 5-like [Mercurialis annua]|uniref:GATA transcription factor 5-like n=1 Tax=Mercurialis annua TaxID=3986 RepID=UPI0024AD54A2|nr:GATA transcription factor 5-like [Mercurialis annua]
MECVIVEAALKTSFRKEMGFRNSPAAIFDDLRAPNNVQQNVASSDDFIVDELLDFSNEDDEQDLVLQEDGGKQQTQQQKEFLDDKISEFGGKVDFECIPTSEHCSRPTPVGLLHRIVNMTPQT